MFWHSLRHHDVGQCGDDPGSGPAAFRTYQQAFAGMFIDQVEQPYAATIMRPCADEAVAPHMVPPLRSQPYTRAVVDPQSPSWLLLLRYLQPLATPDTLHAILAHSPASSLQERRDPAISVTTVLAGKLDDRLRECISVFAVPHDSAACRAAGWSASMPCAPSSHAAAVHGLLRSAVAQGLEVPEAKSFNTRFSRLRFATRRFSFEFSCSNSFSRFAWSTCNPPYSLRQRKYVCSTIQLPYTPEPSSSRSPRPLRSAAAGSPLAQAGTSCLVPYALLVQCLSYPLAQFKLGTPLGQI